MNDSSASSSPVVGSEPSQKQSIGCSDSSKQSHSRLLSDSDVTFTQECKADSDSSDNPQDGKFLCQLSNAEKTSGGGGVAKSLLFPSQNSEKSTYGETGLSQVKSTEIKTVPSEVKSQNATSIIAGLADMDNKESHNHAYILSGSSANTGKEIKSVGNLSCSIFSSEDLHFTEGLSSYFSDLDVSDKKLSGLTSLHCKSSSGDSTTKYTIENYETVKTNQTRQPIDDVKSDDLASLGKHEGNVKYSQLKSEKCSEVDEKKSPLSSAENNFVQIL